MNTSVNQVNQFYVASAVKTGANEVSTLGDIKLKAIEEAGNTELFFQYKGADTVLRSDFIPTKNITSITAVDAENDGYKLRKVSVSLDADPVAGQAYVLGINFKNFFSSGDASQYYKDAAVQATTGMTKKQLLDALKDALNLAFSREDGATATTNPYLTFTTAAAAGSGSTATPDMLIIEEKEQDWVLGVKRQRRIMFDVFCGSIYLGGADVPWGTVTEMTPSTTVGNGKKVADLEWFCLGERGDQYRMMGYPNVIPTKYLVDPTKTYDVLNIHYAFTDTGVSSYRTEKDITIVADSSAASTVVATLKAAVEEYLTPTKASMDAAIATATE